jgi:hypothetical protein
MVMRLKYISIFSMFLSLSLSADCISGLIKTYRGFCQKAATDELIFSHFRNSSVYQDAVEHVTYHQGLEYIGYVQEIYPDFLIYLKTVQENDLLGSPTMHQYYPYGMFSPNTLRYLKVVGDIKREFGDISNLHIVEIRGGYGGQCKLLCDMIGFASYTIVDLPECNLLIRKYLEQFAVENVNFLDSDKLDTSVKCDLVISNFGFSEIEKGEQLDLVNKILCQAPRGYMTGNFRLTNFTLKFLDLEDLIGLLLKDLRMVMLNDEVPLTGSGNQTLIWKPMGTSNI